MCLAIKRVFGEDDDRRLHGPRSYDAGVWRIESANLDLYRSTDVLSLDNVNVAKVTIRREKVQVTENGRVQRRRERDPNDLLITLRDADSFPLNQISDDEIIEAILDWNIGTIKRAPQKQFDNEKKRVLWK